MATTVLCSGQDTDSANIILPRSQTPETGVSAPSEASHVQLITTISDHEDDGDQAFKRRDADANTDSNENREGSKGWAWARIRLNRLIDEARGAASSTVVNFIRH